MLQTQVAGGLSVALEVSDSSLFSSLLIYYSIVLKSIKYLEVTYAISYLNSQLLCFVILGAVLAIAA